MTQQTSYNHVSLICPAPEALELQYYEKTVEGVLLKRHFNLCMLSLVLVHHVFSLHFQFTYLGKL
jgi:hypothetical protein